MPTETLANFHWQHNITSQKTIVIFSLMTKLKVQSVGNETWPQNNWLYKTPTFPKSCILLMPIPLQLFQSQQMVCFKCKTSHITDFHVRCLFLLYSIPSCLHPCSHNSMINPHENVMLVGRQHILRRRMTLVIKLWLLLAFRLKMLRLPRTESCWEEQRADAAWNLSCSGM